MTALDCDWIFCYVIFHYVILFWSFLLIWYLFVNLLNILYKCDVIRLMMNHWKRVRYLHLVLPSDTVDSDQLEFEHIKREATNKQTVVDLMSRIQGTWIWQLKFSFILRLTISPSYTSKIMSFFSWNLRNYHKRSPLYTFPINYFTGSIWSLKNLLYLIFLEQKLIFIYG